METQELSNELHIAIKHLCEEGDDRANAGDDHAACEKYNEAWNLVPEEKEEWEASTWILAAVGEIQFRQRRYDTALISFRRAVQCPSGLGNPYIHLRLGEIQYELGNTKEADDNLARAYMGAGEEIFGSEDPKYLRYLKTILLPPISAK